MRKALFQPFIGASTSVVTGRPNSLSGRLQLVGGHLARLVVAGHLVAELLALDDVAHAGALYGRDVDENVGGAVVRLNKTKTFGGVEPFHCAGGHEESFPWQIFVNPRANAQRFLSRFLMGKFVKGARAC